MLCWAKKSTKEVSIGQSPTLIFETTGVKQRSKGSKKKQTVDIKAQERINLKIYKIQNRKCFVVIKNQSLLKNRFLLMGKCTGWI